MQFPVLRRRGVSRVLRCKPSASAATLPARFPTVRMHLPAGSWRPRRLCRTRSCPTWAYRQPMHATWQPTLGRWSERSCRTGVAATSIGIGARSWRCRHHRQPELGAVCGGGSDFYLRDGPAGQSAVAPCRRAAGASHALDRGRWCDFSIACSGQPVCLQQLANPRLAGGAAGRGADRRHYRPHVVVGGALPRPGQRPGHYAGQ